MNKTGMRVLAGWMVLPVLFQMLVYVDAAEMSRMFALPVSDWADTEASMTAEPPLWRSSQSEFRLTLSFDASPSNNLEAAFWDEAWDGGEDAATLIGWDCGEVFVRDGETYARGVGDFTLSPEASRLTLRVVARLSQQGEPLSTAIWANDVPVGFADADGAPVSFIHSPDWNAARIVSRGAGEKVGDVLIGYAADPSVILTR